jgi:hypothetical protein
LQAVLSDTQETSRSDTPDASRTMGHVALHYQRPEDAPAAAKLLRLLGLVETQALPLPGGAFYRFIVDPKHQARGDGIIYLSVVPDAQRALTDAIRSALKVGTPDEHPAVGGMRAAIEADPEYTFHVGMLLPSLEELERIVLDVQQRAETDPDLKGRVKVTLNRARRGNPEVDARLDASPVYKDAERYAYGSNGVQAFIETDLLSSGLLGESLVLELDYVFPGYKSHILSVVEL